LATKARPPTNVSLEPSVSVLSAATGSPVGDGTPNGSINAGNVSPATGSPNAPARSRRPGARRGVNIVPIRRPTSSRRAGIPTTLASLATPETILRWYREQVAAKYDGSRTRGRPGHPATRGDPSQAAAHDGARESVVGLHAASRRTRKPGLRPPRPTGLGWRRSPATSPTPRPARRRA